MRGLAIGIGIGIALPGAWLDRSAAAQVVYVDDDAPGGGDGSSWGTAFNDLQDALALDGKPGADVSEIWVAAGTYRPDGGSGSRAMSFQLLSGVAVYGGFAGDEQRLEERDPVANPTILSGDIGVPGDDSDNTYRIVLALGVDDTAVLDGFTITGGRATGASVFGRGGGIHSFDADPVIANCILLDNQARRGGTVYLAQGNPTVRDCTIDGSVALDDYGGAMYIAAGTTAVLEDCSVLNSTSLLDGGGLYNAGTGSTLMGCTIGGNGVGPAVFTQSGGGIYNAPGSSATFTACLIENNVAERGGGMHNELCATTLTRCLFTGNVASEHSATGGGGMFNWGATVALTDCSFTGNESVVGGGGISSRIGSSMSLTDCSFQSNEANGSGGGILSAEGSVLVLTDCVFHANSASGTGGAVSASVTAIGCVFSDNVAGNSGGGATAAGFFQDCEFTSNRADEGGGLTIGGASTVIGCSFTGNQSDFQDGGGLYAEQPDGLLVLDCTFTGNDSEYEGGGLEIFDGSVAILSCTIAGNHTTFGGGGVNLRAGVTGIVAGCLVSDNTGLGGAGFGISDVSSFSIVNCLVRNNGRDSGSGGAFRLANSTPSIVNCTIAGNTASNGGGLYSLGSGGASLANCILWDNADSTGMGETAQVLDVQSTTTTLNSCCVEGWTGALGGSGNFGADPQFVDPINQDYRLGPSSPCVDAGHNWRVPADSFDLDGDADVVELLPIDFDGNPRFADARIDDTGCGAAAVVDLGAFEHAGAATARVFPHDLDGDGTVGINDLLLLLAGWGPCGDDPCCMGDVDVDATVGTLDLVGLLEAWR